MASVSEHTQSPVTSVGGSADRGHEGDGRGNAVWTGTGDLQLPPPTPTPTNPQKRDMDERRAAGGQPGDRCFCPLASAVSRQPGPDGEWGSLLDPPPPLCQSNLTTVCMTDRFHRH